MRRETQTLGSCRVKYETLYFQGDNSVHHSKSILLSQRWLVKNYCRKTEQRPHKYPNPVVDKEIFACYNGGNAGVVELADTLDLGSNG